MKGWRDEEDLVSLWVDEREEWIIAADKLSPTNASRRELWEQEFVEVLSYMHRSDMAGLLDWALDSLRAECDSEEGAEECWFGPGFRHAYTCLPSGNRQYPSLRILVLRWAVNAAATLDADEGKAVRREENGMDREEMALDVVYRAKERWGTQFVGGWFTL